MIKINLPAEHVSHVDRDAALHRVHRRPLRGAVAARVRGALQPSLTHALEQQRDAAPVRVRTRAPAAFG